MRVSISIEWDADAREALARKHGEEGKASRRDIQAWMIGSISALMEDLPSDDEPMDYMP